MSSVYGGDISKIDLWVGGLAEDHVEGSQLGELFHTIVLDQFTRLRNHDECWFENRLSEELIAFVRTQTLATVLRRNTGLGTEVQDDVFVVPT